MDSKTIFEFHLIAYVHIAKPPPHRIISYSHTHEHAKSVSKQRWFVRFVNNLLY